MVTPELINYVREQLSTGRTLASLSTDLVTRGWSKEDINEVLHTSLPANNIAPSVSSTDKISSPKLLVNIVILSIFFILGIIIAFFSFESQSNLNEFYRTALHSQGTVVNIESGVSQDIPQVNFIDANGTLHKDIGGDCDRGSCPDVGSKADVIYDPTNPNNSKVLSIESKNFTYNYDSFVERHIALLNLAFTVLFWLPGILITIQMIKRKNIGILYQLNIQSDAVTNQSMKISSGVSTIKINPVYIPITWIIFLDGLQNLLSAARSIPGNSALVDFVTFGISILLGMGLMIVSFGLRKFKKWALYLFTTLLILYYLLLILSFISSVKSIVAILILCLFMIVIGSLLLLFINKQYKNSIAITAPIPQ